MKNNNSNLLFDKSKPGKIGFSLPPSDCPEVIFEENINSNLLRLENLLLPELSEPEIVRHFINLSSKNHHIDKDIFPSSDIPDLAVINGLLFINLLKK